MRCSEGLRSIVKRAKYCTKLGSLNEFLCWIGSEASEVLPCRIREDEVNMYAIDATIVNRGANGFEMNAVRRGY